MSEIYKGLFIVYSPDDGGYYSESVKDEQSKIYKTKELLIKAIDKEATQ